MIKERRDELVQTVCSMIKRYTSSKKDLSKGMKTVDAIERLGVDYHFEDEIRKFMDVLISTSINENDLAGVALWFRLLRQHHYDITCGNYTTYYSKVNCNFSPIRCFCNSRYYLIDGKY